VFLVEVAVEPKSKADQEKLSVALQKLAAQDPTFGVSTDQESGQTILGGMGELHLDGKIDILKRVYEIDANIGQPQVAYRETLGRRTEVVYTHKKQIGDSGQFAQVKILFEPGEPGSGYHFDTSVAGGEVAREFVPGVEKGLALAKENGLLAGFPVIDFKATLTGGAYHDVDSSVLAFEIAARAAFRELRDKASPKLLEPIMRVEVTTPEDCSGDAIGDLNLRRGVIESDETHGKTHVITAFVPLANLFGYSNLLRSLSQGRAAFAMRFVRYDAVPTEDPDPEFPPAIGMRA
jgi:elongation factor G